MSSGATVPVTPRGVSWSQEEATMVWMGHSEQSPGELAEVERREAVRELEAKAEEGALREQRIHEADAARGKVSLIERIKAWVRGRRAED